MPADLSRWVLQRYNPDSESIVVPGRGEIPVTAESVHQTLGLRNSGEEVFYGWDAEAISFINNRYGFESGMAPEITTFCKLIKDMNGRADDDFMRAWLIVVVSCCMCPTMSLNVSPRCYPIVANLERVKRLNFCSFMAKQIRASLCGTMRKKAVTCCVHHMVVLYVDSLVVDIHVPDCPIRAEAWDSKRIGQVAKADRKPEGGYGKLSMKARFRSNRGDGLFAGYEQVEKFVSSKLPPTYNRNKKRKIAAMLSTLCSEISEKLGSFVEGIGKLDKNDDGSSRSYLHKTKRRKNVGDKETKAEEFEHDGGIPEEDAEYLPSLGSGEDGGATSSDDNSDAFVVTRSSAQKQNNFREKPMASRDRENVNMKERTASEVEPGRECAKLEGHTNVTGKVNQGGTHAQFIRRARSEDSLPAGGKAKWAQDHRD